MNVMENENSNGKFGIKWVNEFFLGKKECRRLSLVSLSKKEYTVRNQ